MKMWNGEVWRVEARSVWQEPSPGTGCCISPCFAATEGFGVPASPLVPVSLRFHPRDEPSYSFPLHEGKQAGPCLLSLPSDA